MWKQFCEVHAKAIIHLSVGKYPTLFIDTEENNSSLTDERSMDLFSSIQPFTKTRQLYFVTKTNNLFTFRLPWFFANPCYGKQQHLLILQQ